MLELKTINYIDMEDVCELFGTRIGDYEFTQMVENDSYVRLYCDDEAVFDLEEGIKYFSKSENWEKVNRLENQLELVNYLRLGRAADKTGEVLVWVCW